MLVAQKQEQWIESLIVDQAIIFFEVKSVKQKELFGTKASSIFVLCLFSISVQRNV